MSTSVVSFLIFLPPNYQTINNKKQILINHATEKAELALTLYRKLS